MGLPACSAPGLPAKRGAFSAADWLRLQKGRALAKGGGFKMAAARRRFPAE